MNTLEILAIKQVMEIIKDNIDRYLNSNIDIYRDSKNTTIRIQGLQKHVKF